MSPNSEFNLEKLKIREDLSALITEVRLNNKILTDNVKALNEIVTGNGSPEKGHTIRIAKLEYLEEKKQSHMTWIWGTLGLAISTFIADLIHRIFFHHPGK